MFRWLKVLRPTTFFAATIPILGVLLCIIQREGGAPPASVAAMARADAPEDGHAALADVERGAQLTPREAQFALTTSANRSDEGEATPAPVPGAVSISMLGGPDLVVIPADSNKPRAEQTKWHYIPWFHIEKTSYNSKMRLLICRIDSRLSTQTKNRVYGRLREITGAPIQTAFSLNPVRWQTLTVELSVPDKKFMLRSENSGHDIANGPIPVLYRVKDEELHELLKTNLRNLALTVRSTHPYSAFIRNTMQVESSITVAREALEKVLPKGMRLDDLVKHPLIVDRDALLKLQQVLREEFRVRIEGNPAKFAGLDKVLEKMLDRVTVSQVALHEVSREIIDNAAIWDSKTARLDVSPSERTTMTNALEEATEKRSAFKHAWDTMREEAKKTNDEKSWHKTLMDKMKLDTKLKVGIGIFSGDASLNLEKEHNESDQGAVKALRETFEKMKNAGEMTKETFEKTYRKFKGKDYARSVAGKILRLERVANLDILSFRSALLEHVERLKKGMLERVTFLPLEASNTQQADALREIELIKKTNADTLAKLNAALKDNKMELVALRAKLDDLNSRLTATETRKPHVGSVRIWHVAEGPAWAPMLNPKARRDGPSGERIYKKWIAFPDGVHFDSPPSVVVGFTSIEAYPVTARIKVTKTTEKGFEITIFVWHDTVLYEADFSYVANPK